MKPKTEKPKGKRAVVIYPKRQAPKPRSFSFIGLDKHRYSITPQQKLFAECFCSNSMDKAEAVVEAGYNVYYVKGGGINYNLARVIASENLKKTNVSAYITCLLDKYGLSDDNVDIQLAGVVNQWSDLPSKVRAIDIVYKKRGSYAPDKQEHIFDDKVQAMIVKISKLLPD